MEKRAYNHWVWLRIQSLPLLLAVLLLAAGCQHANIEQLPSDWPLKQLGLPDDSVVREGHVKDDVKVSDDGSAKQWTVFFTCPQDWPSVEASTEKQLKRLHFLKQEVEPEPTPVGAGPISFHSAYVSEDGLYLAVLVYEESPESREALKGGYYTLMLQVNTPPLPQSSDFKPLD